MNPLAALAVMKPVLCVVRSVTVAVKPDDGSLIAIFSWSPELTANVLAFGVNVLPLASCGLGGPLGTPLRVR